MTKPSGSSSWSWTNPGGRGTWTPSANSPRTTSSTPLQLLDPWQRHGDEFALPVAVVDGVGVAGREDRPLRGYVGCYQAGVGPEAVAEGPQRLNLGGAGSDNVDVEVEGRAVLHHR